MLGWPLIYLILFLFLASSGCTVILDPRCMSLSTSSTTSFGLMIASYAGGEEGQHRYNTIPPSTG